MKKKRSNRKKQLLSIQALPIAQVGAIYEEAAAEEEQFHQELAAQSDAYPEGAFAFYEESATVTEGDGDIAVQVVRPCDTSTDASVDLKSVNATAKYGEDFDVYYLDGDEKVYLQQSAEEDTAESADGETSLRSAFAEQTGKETVDTNRRGEYEEYAARVASVEAENEIINAVDGSSVTIPFAAGEYEKKVYVHVNDDDKAES